MRDVGSTHDEGDIAGASNPTAAVLRGTHILNTLHSNSYSLLALCTRDGCRFTHQSPVERNVDGVQRDSAVLVPINAAAVLRATHAAALLTRAPALIYVSCQEPNTRPPPSYTPLWPLSKEATAPPVRQGGKVQGASNTTTRRARTSSAMLFLMTVPFSTVNLEFTLAKIPAPDCCT